MTNSPFGAGPSPQPAIEPSPVATARPNPRRRGPGSLAAAAALLLSACGGHGDGGGEPQYAVRAAMSHWLNDAASYALEGADPLGAKYTLTFALAPMGPAEVPIVGGAAPRSQQLYSAEVEGTSFAAGPTFYFDATNLTFIATDNGTGGCDVTTNNTALPESAAVGAKGALYTDAVYQGCTAASPVIGTATADWALESHAGMVMLCWRLASLDPALATLATQTSCIEIARDGTLGTRASIVVTLMDVTLIDARNF